MSKVPATVKKRLGEIKLNPRRITAREVEETKEYIDKQNVNVSKTNVNKMDALDKELSDLLDQYRKQVQSSVKVTNTGIERKNFYVAEFNDMKYYKNDHIDAKGSYKDGGRRAMNVSIDGGEYIHNEISCSRSCKKYTFFGLQNGGANGPSQCFCSDSWDETTMYGEGDCGRHGGPWCNYVYENMGLPPIPSSMHLGKLYYAEKKLKDKKFTIMEYPRNQIDYTGQANASKIQFYKIANFDSPGNDMISKDFYDYDSAKKYCLEIKAVGFVFDRTTWTFYFKSSIFPNTKKVLNNETDIYLVVPAIKNVEPCNEKVTVVSPTFINKNCVIKSGIPPSNICDGLDSISETGLDDINVRLNKLATNLVGKMKTHMEQADKYNKLQPEKRAKYNDTISKYEKVINLVKTHDTNLATENAISQNALSNVRMREMFMFVVLLIIGTVAIVYFLGFSKLILFIVLTLYYIALYVLVVMKD